MPCALSKGNLGSPFYDADLSKFHIYTTSSDAETIQNSSVFKKLNDFIITKIHIADDVAEMKVPGNEKMTVCHDRGIKECGEKDAAVFLTADTVFADGTFKKMYEIAMTGKKAILLGAVRSDGNALMQELLKHYSETELSITISQRELVRLIYKNYSDRSDLWGVKCPYYWKSSTLIWDVPGKGLLLRRFQLHPLLVIHEKRDDPLYIADNKNLATDGDYVERICPDFDKIHIVEDSDELFIAGLDDVQPEGDSSYTYSVLHHAELIKEYYKPYYIEYFKRKIRFHFEDLSPEWEQVEQESDKVVNNILECIDFFDKVPAALEGFRQLKTERDNSIQQSYRLRMETAQTYNMLGIEFHKGGRVQEAESAMQKSLALFPHQFFAHRNLAVIYLNKGEWEKAFAHIQAAIQMDHSQTELWHVVIGILQNQGINPQIIEWLKRVVHLIPNDPGFLNALSQIGLRYKSLELIQLVFSKSQG